VAGPRLETLARFVDEVEQSAPATRFPMSGGKLQEPGEAIELLVMRCCPAHKVFRHLRLQLRSFRLKWRVVVGVGMDADEGAELGTVLHQGRMKKVAAPGA
jgi:hypothetical protein